MDKLIVATDKAPKAIGPYSQAVGVGQMLFLSGQIPLSPVTGEVVGQDVAQQTEQVLENLAAVLSAAGLSFEHLVKTTIYLRDLEDFKTVNEVYAKRFSDAPPARATVEVSRLPRNVKVEIDGIAVIPPAES
ncbi:MAG: RidA family protein [Myxococcota bacterium]|jgi:2-iminobutanoate/2-iminopropanoate deaminase|nr:RidA family protein [Myxococcota bacterium]